jgi:beta-lactamase regulating signal transducer with metallopeptidase domain
MLANRYLVFIGWALLVVLWQTTIVAVLLAVWRLRFGRARSEADYHAALAALFGGCALAVAVPLLLFAWPADVPGPVGSAFGAAAHLPTNGGAPVLTTLRAAAAAIDASRIIRVDALAAAAALVWIVGAGILALRLVGALLVTRRIVLRARRLDDAEFARIAAQSSARAGVVRPVDLRESPDVEAPAVLNWRHPVMLVPRAALLGLDSRQMSALLVHEFAHVRRHDYVVNLVQSIVDAVFFFSPAVLWMSRRVREAREFCCDDAAVAQCGSAGTYVDALTTLAALATLNVTRTAQGVSGARLITRVRRLLKEDPMPRLNVLRITGLAAALVLLVATGIRVSAASAARTPRHAAAPTAQGSIPYGYAPSQEGSGIQITRVRRGDVALLDAVALQNVADQVVTSVQFTVAIETRTAAGPLPVRLFTSAAIPVSIGPGAVAEVAPGVPSAEQLQSVAREVPGASLQSFFGLNAVTFANGYRWHVNPNPDALSGPDALGIARLINPRTLIERDAAKTPVPFKWCVDDRGRATSHGGLIPILNEPGAMMRCTDGRWVDAR